MIKVLVVAVTVFLSVLLANSTMPGARFYMANGDKSSVFEMMLKRDIETTGFILSDPHERINDIYKAKYGVPLIKGKPNDAYDPSFKVTLDNLGFFSISNDKAIRPLLLKAPKLGGFSPFNLLIYKQKGESRTYVGHLSPEAMLNITGVKDEGIRTAFSASFVPLDRLLAAKIGGEVKNITYKHSAAEPMMEFELKFDRSEVLDDFVDAFQEKFEAAMEAHNFIIAGYKNYAETYADDGLDFDRFDRYWVYSLCHFVFSYNIFNKGRPDAGIFAPCSMYMYIEKGRNILHIGMPTLENWKAVLDITDPDKLQRLKDIDTEIIQIMTEKLGAKKI